MLYKIKSNPMHTLYGALPVPVVTVRVTRVALVAHRYNYATPSCRTSQYRRTFIRLSVSPRNGGGEPAFDGVGLEGLRAGPMLFYWICCSLSIRHLLVSLSLPTFYVLVVLLGWGLHTDRVSISLFRPFIDAYLNNNNQ